MVPGEISPCMKQRQVTARLLALITRYSAEYNMPIFVLPTYRQWVYIAVEQNSRKSNYNVCWVKRSPYVHSFILKLSVTGATFLCIFNRQKYWLQLIRSQK